jgi:hypothetical protein
MADLDIIAINRARSMAFATDGGLVPITNWFDVDADECGPEDAVACVAGPDSEGKWWSLDLSAFGDQPRH